MGLVAAYTGGAPVDDATGLSEEPRAFRAGRPVNASLKSTHLKDISGRLVLALASLGTGRQGMARTAHRRDASTAGENPARKVKGRSLYGKLV